MISMKEVDQFLQQRVFLLAPGCLAANNPLARKNNSPSFSWDNLDKEQKKYKVMTILGSNLMWTHSNFSNKSHLDNDSSPFACVMSSPTFSKSSKLASKKDGYDVVGGEFLFQSLNMFVDLNRGDGIYKIMWKANQYQHQTMASREPSQKFTRLGCSVQVNATLSSVLTNCSKEEAPKQSTSKKQAPKQSTSKKQAPKKSSSSKHKPRSSSSQQAQRVL
jgi:hypothetical protein